MDLPNFSAIVLDAKLVVEDLFVLFVNVAYKKLLPFMRNVMRWIHVKKAMECEGSRGIAKN